MTRTNRRFVLSAKRLELLEGMLHAEGVNRAQERRVIRRRNSEVPAPLTFSQKRLWFIEQLAPGTAYIIPAALRVRGNLDIAVFERACSEVVRRHEALRTVFSAIDGRPQQQVREDIQADVRVVNLQGMTPEKVEPEVQRRAESLLKKPFNLETGPLLRIELLCIADNESVVLLSMHHIISDQWSLGVLLRELMSLYAAFAVGRVSDLAELSVQYPDYAFWQQEILRKETLQEDLDYWVQQLRGASSEIGLPLVRPRPKEKSYRGAAQPVELASPLVAELRALARTEGATLFMLLAAAFKALLYRLSGNEDIVVGTPVANRGLAEVEPLIGFFVNTLVLRTDLSGNPTFRELMHRVSQVCLDAYQHQNLPFERLVEELQPARSLARTPLFQVAFTFQNVPFPDWSAGSIHVEPIWVDSGTAKFDLELHLLEDGDKIWGHLEYSLDVLDECIARRMVGYFDRLLRSLTANPDQAVTLISLLSEEEQRCQLVQCNDTRQEWPDHSWMHQWFEQQVLAAPKAEALRFEEQSLTYGDLNRRANQLAHRLRRLGVGKDTLVGICVERSVEMVVSQLATLKAGGAYLPLDPSYPRARLEFMLEDSRVPVLLAQRRVLTRLTETLEAQVLCVDELVDELASESSENPELQVNGEDLAYVIYTSGSTGKPKGVQIPHRALANFLRSMQQRPGINAQDTILALTSLCFDIHVLELLLPLVVGARIFLVSRELAGDGRRLCDALESSQATIMQATPSTWRMLLDAGWPGTPRLRMLCGGEALPLELAQQLLSKGASLWNMYGPTETAVWSAVARVGHGQISIGDPIANTELYVLDGQRQLTPLGVPGELYIGGAGLARGYLGRPELTAERFVPHPFEIGLGDRLYRTGDLVRRRADGSIEFLGRMDHQVKVRGFRIELGEIEQVLATHPQVRSAIVLAREYPAGDTRLVAYVTGDETPKAGELAAHLKERLPEHMVPSAFVFLTSFPLTPNGKVDRKALPEPESVRPELQTAYEAPRDELERSIAEVWGQLLGIDRVGVYDSFFDLGGHSLLVTQAASRLKSALGVDLPVRDLFEFPTIAKLAIRIREGGQRSSRSESAIPVADRGQYLPLSFAQERLCVYHPLGAEDPFHNVVTGMRLLGRLDASALEQSLSNIVRRHETLRTRFVRLSSGFVQVVDDDLTWSLSSVDLKASDAATQSAEIRRLVERESRQPFRLAEGSLIRGTLVSLADEQSVLLLVMHHVITDNWSFGVLVRELTYLYDAYSAGRQPMLPQIAVQYPDFAVWQRQQYASGAFDEHLNYWRQQLKGLPPALHFAACDRQTEAAVDGFVRPFAVNKTISAGLHGIARGVGATLFMVLMAAYDVLLSSFSGSNDIAVGFPNAGRQRQETENLIGYFVNTLVLRADLSGGLTFRNLVGRVRELTLDAYTHAEAPLHLLREELAEDPFRISFNLLNAPVPPLELNRLKVEPLDFGSGYVAPHVLPQLIPAEVDLLLVIREEGEELRGIWLYAPNRIGTRTMGSMARQWERLLDLVASNPDTGVDELRRRVLSGSESTPASHQTGHALNLSEEMV